MTQAQIEQQRRVAAEIKLNNRKQNAAPVIFLAVIFGVVILLIVGQKMVQSHQTNYKYYQAIEAAR